ncbi:MAG TPA: tetratricopeptide repeat protein [Phycisphaerae bacterium]|nr:tetratricopeptide repeat protein [Phycisphaerae bacterium]HRR84254.1 tetratricopeptide repeat protein [Phycisphaerae bacterium]
MMTHGRLVGDGFVQTGRGLAVLAMGMMLLAGCAGREHYDRGRMLMASGQYDQAVTAFDEALAQSPGNSRYHNGLLEAKSLAADQHVKTATQFVAEKRLSDAQKELDTALKLVPAHPEGVPLAAQIAPQIAECEKTIAEAREALARQEWTEGARLIAEAGRIDRSHPQLELLRKEAADTVTARQLLAARRALGARDWDAALAACAQVRRVAPDNTEVVGIEQQVKDRREAQRVFDSAKAMIDAGNSSGALGPLQQAAGLWPDNDEIVSTLDRVKGQVVDKLSTRSRDEARAGRFQAALQTLDEAMVLEPNRESLRQQRKQVLDGWIAGLMEDYRRHKAQGAWELAWVDAVQALALAPTQPEPVVQACLTAEEGIRRAIAYNLNVLLAPSDERRLDDIMAVCTVLLEELGDQRPDHVCLTEQSILSKLLAEFAVSSADVNNRDKLQAVGRRLRGPNVFLFVNMDIVKVNVGNPESAASGTSRLDLRMNMVDVSSGRLLWKCVEMLPLEGSASPGGTAATARPVAVVHASGPLTADGIAVLRPVLRARVSDMYRGHAGSFLQAAGAATGDTATEFNVRFLFDLVSMPDAQTLGSVLDAVFGSVVSGDILAACKKIASERLALAKRVAARDEHPAEKMSGPAILPASRPAVSTATAPVAHQAPAVPSASKPATAAPASADVRSFPATQPRPVPVPASTSAASTAPAEDRGPVRVFQGVVSRDDDRFTKELATVDGIVVKLLDTDADPLDADIEIRVGKRSKKYEDKPQGARIGGYGESGRAYVVVILKIDDETETVHFAVERVDTVPQQQP